MPESISATSTSSPVRRARRRRSWCGPRASVVASAGVPSVAARVSPSSASASSSSLRVVNAWSTTTERTPASAAHRRATERDGTLAITPSIRRTRCVTLPPAALTAAAEPLPTTTTGTPRSRAKAEETRKSEQRSAAISPSGEDEATASAVPADAVHNPRPVRGGKLNSTAHWCSSWVESIRRWVWYRRRVENGSRGTWTNVRTAFRRVSLRSRAGSSAVRAADS